jgi:peptidoglycan/LPS O-acetylase OafA/YrhL
MHSLDGLRGAAALAVVAYHALDNVKMSPSLLSGWLMSPLGALVNGPGAVHLFFVLSGYVLAITLSRDPGAAGVPRFYVRRLFRIQPPFMFAVLFAWVLSLDYPVVGGLGVALTSSNPCFHTPGRLLPWALLLPSSAYGQLLVGWSLYVELVMSLAFPLLMFLGRRIHALVPIGLGVLLLWPPVLSMHVARFTFDFAIGLALYLHRDGIERWVTRLPNAAMPVFVLLGVVLLQLPFALTRFRRGTAVLEQGHDADTIVLMALGSGILIAAALYLDPVRRFFSMPWARFFGRISYSLYLLHMAVILLLICRVTGQKLPWYEGLVVFAIALAVSSVLANLVWHRVEEPSIRAGRWVNRKLGRRRPAQP